MRVTIRFAKKDVDLIMIASQYRLKDMLRLAIQHYTGQTTETIPLPPNISVKPMECATIYLGKEDIDIIDFMKQFAIGNRSAAAKLLLRHATSQCDLRFLQGQIENPQKTINKAQKHEKKATQQKAIGKMDNLKNQQEAVAQTETDDESAVFDLI